MDIEEVSVRHMCDKAAGNGKVSLAGVNCPSGLVFATIDKVLFADFNRITKSIRMTEGYRCGKNMFSTGPLTGVISFCLPLTGVIRFCLPQV